MSFRVIKGNDPVAAAAKMHALKELKEKVAPEPDKVEVKEEIINNVIIGPWKRKETV